NSANFKPMYTRIRHHWPKPNRLLYLVTPSTAYGAVPEPEQEGHLADIIFKYNNEMGID
ncbi:hypothetical protein SOVF_214440, partial [Spinacia oleracea]